MGEILPAGKGQETLSHKASTTAWPEKRVPGEYPVAGMMEDVAGSAGLEMDVVDIGRRMQRTEWRI